MTTRKDMRGTKGSSLTPFFFRAVVTNGGSKGLNLTEFLSDWLQVRISVVKKNDSSIVLLIEDTGVLKA